MTNTTTTPAGEPPRWVTEAAFGLPLFRDDIAEEHPFVTGIDLPESSYTPNPDRGALVRGEDMLTLAGRQTWEATCPACWLHKPAATFGRDGLCHDCTGEG